MLRVGQRLWKLGVEVALGRIKLGLNEEDSRGEVGTIEFCAAEVGCSVVNSLALSPNQLARAL